MGEHDFGQNIIPVSDQLKLFVYGSLKLGECNQHVIKPWVVEWEKASTFGEMRLRPDHYPALFLPDYGTLGTSDYPRDLLLDEAPELTEGTLIRGQLLTLQQGETALQRLDEFEGFFPGGRSEYLRVSLSVNTESGPKACWTYTGAGKSPSKWPILESWPPPGLNKAPEPYYHGL